MVDNALALYGDRLLRTRNENAKTQKKDAEEGEKRIDLFLCLLCALCVSAVQLCFREVCVERHVVARAEEIPPGGRKIVRIAGRGEIGIFNVDGAFYALKNTCAHQGARVCLGKIVGTALPSEVYEYRYDGGAHPALPMARVGIRHHYRADPSLIRVSKCSRTPSKSWTATSPC